MHFLLRGVVVSNKSLTNCAPCGAEYYSKVQHTAFSLDSTSHQDGEE